MERSKYQECLSNESRQRYLQKISKINNVDPYCLKKEELVFEKDFYPKITYPDIVNYLLFAPSPVTSDELKCYKSMDAYNQFLCGWVKEISFKLFEDGNICLVLGRVIFFLNF